MGTKRQKGRITHWNAERGFGFVTPVGGGERVFLHVSSIADRRRQPAEGDMVTYDTTFDERNRPRAVAVKRSIPISQKSRPISRSVESSSFFSPTRSQYKFLCGQIGPVPIPARNSYSANI